ncbi:hypothetical protein EV191_102302 [Tamaricihabitans halophyticus]|uniref:Uncharacterized protein n=2 Tax=Tamaricihabitans halophyticus TaxID=1262583 RepID=A0A4R2QXZ3_9PSEU|nr:hypothetical protein EV191_102302 [Tamaricihabitans halophyticus]
MNTMTGYALPESMAELIADCTDIPGSIQAERGIPQQRAAAPWAVSESCLAQVEDLDLYV